MSWRTHIELPCGADERAVAIPVDGAVLRGNLILPSAPAELGAVLIHGWGGVRSGPHNLMTALARYLGELGIPSLRFDLRGRGESDGDPDATSLTTMAEDSLAAVADLKKAANIHKVLVLGICSGGNVGIGILDRCPDVEALFLMSVYPFGDDDAFQRDAQRTAYHMKQYWRKLWMLHSWRKLFRGQIDFAAIRAILLKPWTRRLQARKESPDAVEAETGPQPLENLLKRRLRVKMIYGEADPEFAVSRDYYRDFAEKHDYPLTMVTIAGANHNFYALEWMQGLKDELQTFLKDIT